MDEGIGLTEQETRHLAMRIAAARVSRPGDWMEWEDYPLLGQYAFERLVTAVDDISDGLWAKVRRMDFTEDIDSAHLQEKTG